MFFPEGRIRVHLYGQPCDMRKSFDGLSALVRNALGRDPMDGSLYVYVNRKATQMRVLYFDRSGYCVWGKRLEAGKECCIQHSAPCDKRLWHTQKPWPSYVKILIALRRRLQKTTSQPQKGSTSSWARQMRANPSMPARKSILATATRMRICAVSWITPLPNPTGTTALSPRPQRQPPSPGRAADRPGPAATVGSRPGSPAMRRSTR